MIKIPCWCYDNASDFNVKSPIVHIGSTRKTIRFTNLLGENLYAIYNGLSNLPQEVWYKLQNISDLTFGDSILSKKDELLIIGVQHMEDSSVMIVTAEWIAKAESSLNKLKICADELKITASGLATVADNVVAYGTAVSSDMCISGDLHVERLHTTNNPKERKGENNTMNNMFGNIRTGKAGSNYAITYFGGIAFNGKTYHKGKIFEAQSMTFPCDMLYLVPATSVKKGDIIEKDGVAYHILEVENSGTIEAVNLYNGKEENLVPGGPFGVSLYSKLFNPFGDMKGDNAFGNMMLMQSMLGGGSGDSGNAMMMAMLMSQGGFKLPSFDLPNLETQKIEKE